MTKQDKGESMKEGLSETGGSKKASLKMWSLSTGLNKVKKWGKLITGGRSFQADE